MAVALNGITVTHFLVALALLGVGWNFMYTGGTTLLTESYAPAEKARTQGANDFIVFATMGVSSLASGAMVSTAGWEAMNRACCRSSRRSPPSCSGSRGGGAPSPARCSAVA